MRRLETSLFFLIRFRTGFDSLTPVRSAFGLLVYVAASQATPFSTSLGMTETRPRQLLRFSLAAGKCSLAAEFWY
jgi:hypothetical protein